MIRNQKSTHGIIPARSVSVAARTREPEEQSFSKTLFNGVLTGIASAFVAGILLTFIMTAIAYANPDPASLLSPLSLAALLPTMFAGGFVCAKKVKEAPLICGLVCGGIITVLTIACSIILRGLSSSGYEFWQSTLLHGIAVTFCILGSFAGNVKKKQKPGKRRFG